MRSLAAALNVTATALYWHVRTKEDVLDLAFDHIFGEVALPELTDWQDDVRCLMRAWRAVLLRHPWAPAWIGRPVLGPQVLARTEFLQSALSRGGLTDVHLAVTTHLLANHVIGAALTETTYRRTPDARTRLEVRRHITADPAAFPTLNASGHLDAGRWDDDELFERGLDAILTSASLKTRQQTSAADPR
jgi:AcrR family transcriptional regulator